MKKLLIAVGALVILVPVILLILSSSSVVKFQPPVTTIGIETPVHVRVENPHGFRRLTAWVEQNGARQQVFETTSPSRRLRFLGGSQPPAEVVFPAGTKKAPALKDGKGRLVVEVVANDFRGSTDSASADVQIITRPPSVVADGAQHYINQGGSELVTFNVSGYWTEAGVRVGKYTFRSFPMPGKPEDSGERFSLFAFPWDTPADAIPMVYAKNPAGNEATARFWFKLFPKKFRSRELEIPDSFLEKVVNQIEPGGTGDLLSRFLKINGDLRRANNATLAGLRLKTEQKWLWREPFVQLANSKVESLFADTRAYMYHGKKVDEQTHLGFDLSVVQHTPVLASNDGKVALAENLGIYGNCIVLDHGYGLQSIYGHLSELGVKPGEMVKRDQQIGRSGSTGLAGGDHLHYSMQVDGIQVTPVEWWDGHWIQDRIFSKVPPQR